MKLMLDHTQRLNLHALLGAQRERVVWNPALSLLAKDFEFSDPELARIKAVIEMWDSYGANADRRWLQPRMCSSTASSSAPAIMPKWYRSKS